MRGRDAFGALALAGALALGPVVPAAASAAADAPTVSISSVASPVSLGDHLEIYGSATDNGTGPQPLALGGAVLWHGVQIGSLMAPSFPNALQPGQTAYFQLQSASPLTYQPGMVDGDPLSVVVTENGVPILTESVSAAGVQPPSPYWAIGFADAHAGWLSPLADDPAGGTIAHAYVLVGLSASAPGPETAWIGGNAVFDEAGGYFDQTWTYPLRPVTLNPGQTMSLTLGTAGGIEPVYPGHNLVETIHLSTGQAATANLPVVSAAAGGATPQQVASDSGSGVVSVTVGQVTATASGGSGSVYLGMAQETAGSDVLIPVAVSPGSTFTSLSLSSCLHTGTVFHVNGEAIADAAYDASSGCSTVTFTAATSPPLGAFGHAI